jgi:acyl carrier protein
MESRAAIREYVEKKLLNGRLKSDDEALFTNGAIDSFGVLELIAFLEKEFKIRIDTRRQDLKDFDSVNKTADLVEKLSNEHAQRA